MSRKDFRSIASALCSVKPNTENRIAVDTLQWQACVSAIADVCAESNERFNRIKFLRACNGN